MSALQQTEAKLAQLEDERVKREQAIERILGLLDQANTKRREEPENSKYYSDLLNRLETALDEAKASLAECHKLIDRVTARRDRLKERAAGQSGDHTTPDDDEATEETALDGATSIAAPQPLSADIGEGNPERLLAAAKHVASTPIPFIGDLLLEEVARARAYLIQKSESGELDDFDSRVAVRVALAGEIGNENAGEGPVEGRRKQAELREAIDKLEQVRIHELTIGEINLLLNCYAVLQRKLSPTSNDERVRTLLERSLRTINDQCQRILRKIVQLKE